MTRFSGKSVLVTGAGRGLGRQLSLDFARNGAKVIVNYASSENNANEVVKLIKDAGGRAVACKADISSLNEVNNLVDVVMEEYGKIDVHVNNAGVSLDAPFLDISEKDLDRAIGVNLKGPFLLSQAVGRHMVAARSGCIINISATTAVRARAGNANYAVSKAGLNMLTQCMALELAPHVKVNTVALGIVDSPLLRELYSENDINEAINALPLKRMATYKETSDFVLMLASDTASFVTGQTIPFDGGRIMR